MKSIQPSKYPCRCCIIPEIVLEELNKKGADIELPNVQMDKAMRMHRQSIMVMQTALPTIHGTSARRVFDSQNMGSTRLKIVREEGDRKSVV